MDEYQIWRMFAYTLEGVTGVFHYRRQGRTQILSAPDTAKARRMLRGYAYQLASDGHLVTQATCRDGRFGIRIYAPNSAPPAEERDASAAALAAVPISAAERPAERAARSPSVLAASLGLKAPPPRADWLIPEE